MTNTINNVPRELLADLLGNDHDKRIMAERHLLAMLANAPSPASVDGLNRYEVFPYLDDEVAELDICESDDGTFVKYDDARAIIDGLRGENERIRLNIAEYNEAISCYQSERDRQAQRIGELEGLLRGVHGWIDESARVYRHNSTSVMLYRIDAALSAGKEDAQ